MDVVLGVAVAGPRARLALVGAGAQGADVIDESVVDLADNPMQKLTETVVGTYRLLADENHRLLATRLCWSDPQSADRLRRVLEDSGIQDVAVVSETQARTGAGRSALGVRPDDDPTVALARGAAVAAGLAGDATAMAPAAGLAGDATAMAPTVGWTGDATAMAPTVGLTGDATGMAPTVGWTGDATAMARAPQGTPAAGQVGPDLAYSMAGDSDLLPMEWLTEPEDEDDDAKTGPVGLGSRRLAAMDAVLGLAVAGSVARLALVGPVGGGYAAIKHLVVELPMHPFETLVQAATDAQQALAAEGRHLVATRVYSPDPAQAEALRQALAGSGLQDVGLVSEADAVGSLLRTVFRGAALPGAVALVVAAEAATLFALGAAGAAEALAAAALQGVDAATAAADMLLDWLRTAPFAVDAAYVMGTLEDLTKVAEELRKRSRLRVDVMQRPEFAFARGAALAAGLAPTTPQPPTTAGAPTAMAPAAGLAGAETAFAPAAEPAAGEPQLAYSEADDGQPLGTDEYGDGYADTDDEAGTGPARLSRRSLLIGNAVIAFAVIGFASLAAAVAIAVRPAASQAPVVGLQNAAPGKFMPLLPTEQQAPVPPPPPDAPNAGFQGGVIPDSNGYIPPQLISPGAPPATPVPESPGNPNGPVPVPVIVPYPGWRPPYPGWRPYPGWPYKPPPTWTTPTTPTTPTTTTSTPTITPYVPPTTPTTPPTEPPTTPHTTEPPTEPPTTPHTTEPPTQPPTTPHTTEPPTTVEPPTSKAPPPTTAAPPPTQAPTVTQAPTQQTVPQQPHTQQPVPQPPAPQPPHTQAPAPQPPAPQPPHTQQPVPQAPRTQQPVPQAPHTTR